MVEPLTLRASNRGLLFNDMRRNHDAIADFTTIIEQLNARYIDAWNNIAFAYKYARLFSPLCAHPHPVAWAAIKMPNAVQLAHSI